MRRSKEPKESIFSIDPVHHKVDIYNAELSGTHRLINDIWAEKYRFGNEEHPYVSMRRMVEGVYAKDNSPEWKQKTLDALRLGLWVPGGRIQAGAGTPKVVTMLNCFVCQTIDDSMSGIAEAIKDAMLTMQQGGGIGMDFSTLRPNGAKLYRTGAVASGPLPFMEMWDSMCKTIMSAGARRGAMMATMDCEHPDLPRFITAKEEAGKLTNFNLSVLISDAFMAAVDADEDWYLGCGVPRADDVHYFVVERDDEHFNGKWYAYSRWRARELWELILKHTYQYSEPGVIFIDRINNENNLKYIENIRCTNPCGEQPLPPDGCCNLGAVNLARMVKNPFTSKATFDYELLAKTIQVGVRFLDNVIDTTIYPLESQKKEEFDKRRIGVGITGLANALAQLGMAYGAKDAMVTVSAIMRILKEESYNTSALLAKVRGPFKLYKADKWGDTPVVKSLPTNIRQKIKKYGIRNGVLLTIAPTGTTSIYAGNVSSGLEPVFAHSMKRRVRQLIKGTSDETLVFYDIYDYNVHLYASVNGITPAAALEHFKLNGHLFNTHETLTVQQHLAVQAVCQEHVDASISKTINCPEDMTYEEFIEVYNGAYASGCKGCTTYRPSDVRGSVLQSSDSSGHNGNSNTNANAKAKADVILRSRPNILYGMTHKIKWPAENASYYVTINQDDSFQPYEIFIQSTSSKYVDWTTALSLMISAIMRKGGDISFIPEELRKVVSMNDTAWINGKFYGSLVALIGDTIGQHLDTLENNPEIGINVALEHAVEHEEEAPQGNLEVCPQCSQPTLKHEEGCKKCLNCGYSSC